MKVTAPVNAAEVALESERGDWKRHFEGMSLVPKDVIDATDHDLISNMRIEVDRGVLCQPPLSVRLDLPIKHLYRQHHLHNRSQQPYNPNAKKKKNDGIDFDLYYAFILPAFLVTVEDGFFTAVKEIESYQTSWVWKPEKLAEAWEHGDRPAPFW